MMVLKLSWELQTDKYSPSSETGEADSDKGKDPGTFNMEDVAEDVNENCIGDGSWDARSGTPPASGSFFDPEWGLVEMGGYDGSGTDLDSMEVTTDGLVWETLSRVPGL